MSTLILTWTIKPFWNLNKCNYKSTSINYNDRHNEYLSAIIYYITQSNFDNIIFWDNSNYKDINIDIINNLSIIYNKKFEYITFKWNKEIIDNYWYWIWEAEILDYIYKNSKLLKIENDFFKITWRYILLNINEIIEEYKENEYFFYKWWRPEISQLFITTSFFKCSKTFYKKNLYKKVINFYEKNSCNLILENIYYILLKNNIKSNTIKKIPFIINYFDYISNKKIKSPLLYRQIILIFYKKIWLLWYWKIHFFIDYIKFKKLFWKYIK